ncbi:MAG TPA: hypothetical protein VK541_14690 [Pedobacter sp.]|uniref:hypothetical protein n=1 Tax=Pedobacter sp. TaxID=1411316 RepID=UPI002BC32022|nr:hypothetical protein [Pedobacter sp.]HMI03728.1 hypothetical protein [Pedobacter sp.]
MFETKDILLYESGNGGELAIINNDLALAERLYQQAYLCLFGGNVEADTLGNEIATEIRQDWWANSLLFGDNKAKQFNSETERALNNNALTSTGRLNIQRAVENDLKYFKNVAEFVVGVSLLGRDKVEISIKLTQPKNQQGESLQLIWDNAKKELITDKII